MSVTWLYVEGGIEIRELMYQPEAAGHFDL